MKIQRIDSNKILNVLPRKYRSKLKDPIKIICNFLNYMPWDNMTFMLLETKFTYCPKETKKYNENSLELSQDVGIFGYEAKKEYNESMMFSRGKMIDSELSRIENYTNKDYIKYFLNPIRDFIYIIPYVKDVFLYDSYTTTSYNSVKLKFIDLINNLCIYLVKDTINKGVICPCNNKLYVSINTHITSQSHIRNMMIKGLGRVVFLDNDIRRIIMNILRICPNGTLRRFLEEN